MKKSPAERHSRPPVRRMIRIHDAIQSGRYPNCAEMAVEMEVSHKTAKRDVEFMRDEMCLPIEFEPHRKGYYYSKPVDKFPMVPVTEAEIFALLVADKAIAQYHGTPFQKPLRMAFEKLTGQLGKEEQYSLANLDGALSFRPFAPEDTDLRIFETVTRGLTERRALKFSYRKPGTKDAEQRHAHPYHLTCNNNGWYLMTHDVKRGGIRTFALVRVKEPELTGEHFVKPKDFDPDKHLKGSFGVMSGDGDYEVVIEFDAWATDMLQGRAWHSSQKVTPLPGGGSHMQFRLSALEEVERWILSWGTHANVIKPAALAERVGKTGAELARRYGT
jgi:predicted DNA-binding transcriptional regulator YafY